MENDIDIEKETYIDDTFVDNEVEEEASSKEETTVDETSNVGDQTNEDDMPVFERDDWADKVERLVEDYPISRQFLEEIGDIILEDDNLWNDEQCLERALLTVLSEHYTATDKMAEDEEFLEKYIYNNEAIRSKIVDDYVETLDRSRLPSTMVRGGRISLAEPKRPRSIREAGAMAERIIGR